MKLYAIYKKGYGHRGNIIASKPSKAIRNFLIAAMLPKNPSYRAIIAVKGKHY